MIWFSYFPHFQELFVHSNIHCLGISEANLKSVHDSNLVQLEDYTLHTCDTISNPNLLTSRVVVYTHRSLVVKLRPDLMSNIYSSV